MVRQYRFLLRTAPPDALEAAHDEALQGLDAPARTAVLEAIQEGLAAGHRLGPDDVRRMGHLLVSGERRDPGAFLRACRPAALGALAQAVIDSEATFGLFSGYAAWDGADPEPEDDSAWRDGGFEPDSGRWSITRNPGRDESGIPHGGGPGFGGGGDGGGMG